MTNREHTFRRMMRLRKITMARIANALEISQQSVRNKITNIYWTMDELDKLTKIFKISLQDVRELVYNNHERLNEIINEDE